MVDHLPTALNPLSGPLLIPCLCDENDYDNLGFSTYPRRMGWQQRDGHIEWKDSSEKSRIWSKTTEQEEERNRFFQSWLFFGLLCDTMGICGVSVNASDFTRWDDLRERKFITTSRLPLYLDQWQESVANQPLNLQLANLRKVAAVLFDARNAIWGNFISSGNHDLNEEIVFSFDVLLETLNGARIKTWNRPEHQEERLPWSGIPEGLFSRFTHGYTISKMKRLGWCPSDIMMLHDLLSSRALYLATTLPRPMMRKDHASCTDNSCLARQVDEDNYTTAHAILGCGCEMLAVDSGKATHILQQGGFPLVALTQSKDDIEVEVVDADPSRPFIAISHVWADQLGNAQGNALPRCQLIRLRAIATKFLDSSNQSANPIVHIWLDTLCVPVRSLGRKLALASIKKPYQHAKLVLVLDKELQDATLDTGCDEIAMRVLCCGWMRRLWALEEAIVADTKLVFLFKEGPVAWQEFAPQDLAAYTRQPPKQDHLHLLANLLTLRPVKERKTDMFTTLVKIITYRATSRVSDETICLASMMGLGAQSLPYTTPAKRMKEFLLLAREVPRSLLFVSEPRMEDEPGFRWAPPSFLGRTGFAIITLAAGEEAAVCGERGLMGRWPGFVIRHSDPVHTKSGMAEEFYLQDSRTGGWWWMSLATIMDTNLRREKWQATWRSFKEGKLGHPGVVMDRMGEMSRAVLVLIEKVEDGIGFARYLERLYARPMAPSDVTAFGGPNYWLGVGEDGVPRNQTEVGEGGSRVAFGDLKERRWCIT